MKDKRWILGAPAVLGAGLLAGCFGGGGGDDGMVSYSGIVADGPLQGATVCYDLDDSGTCDDGEPTAAAATGADGRFTLRVPRDVAGAHAVLALIPATAIDADTGQPIGAALSLRTPATGTAGDQTVAVTALSTAVAELVDGQGLTTAEAAAQVQAALGLAVSPLADFKASNSGEAEQAAATAARALTATLVRSALLADAAGVSASQRQALLGQMLQGQLGAVANAVQSATGDSAAERAAVAAAAVLAAMNLSADTVAVLAEAAATPASPAEADGPFVSVRRFAYTDAENWSATLYLGDSRERDEQGRFVAHEVRQTVSGGVAQPFNRNQAYWNGSDWVECAPSWQVITGVHTDAQGRQHSTYCGGPQSLTPSVVMHDIGGASMREVVARIRAWPMPDSPGAHTNAAGLPVNWGPDPALLPEDAVFPAGSQMSTRTSFGNTNAPDRLELTNKSRVRWSDGIWRQATTLEQYGAMTGDLADASVVPGSGNAVFVADLPIAAPADASLEPRQRWLAAFDFSAMRIRFYGCELRKADQQVQNCAAQGDGTLSIVTQGDARLLRVSTGYPAALRQGLGWQRFWAERLGTVWRGATDLPVTRSDQRLNGTAWEALRTVLGLPAYTVPTAPVASSDVWLLKTFTFTDLANYSFRYFTGSTATVDSAGYFSLDDVRRTVVGGLAQAVDLGNRLYLVDGQWQACASDGVAALKAEVPPGEQSVWCGGYVEQRTGSFRVTLAGRRMADVVNDVRAWGSRDGSFDYRTWGPDPAVHTQLATATFPEGAYMEYRQGQQLATPWTLGAAAGDQVRVPPGSNTSVPFVQWPYAVSLDEFVAANPGDLKGASVNGSIAFWVWGYDLAEPPAAGLTTRAEIRVAFDANGQKARFYRNYRAADTGSTTQYETLLDTTYSIETVGGLRLLKFAALPSGFEDDFQFVRAFGERAGGVWYAWKDSVSTSPTHNLRLNGAAGQALFSALGVQ